MKTIYPSLLAANQLRLEEEIKQLDPYVQGYHLDIMDNHFVPNLSWGPLVVNAIAQTTPRRLWLHLMIDNPVSLISHFDIPPESRCTFHAETVLNVPTFIENIYTKAWAPGIALNPTIPIEYIMPYIAQLEHILIMGVEPGFSGQKLLEHTVRNISLLKEYRTNHQLDFRIAFDGGINSNTIGMLATHGVDDFVCGSALFSTIDPITSLQELNNQINNSKEMLG